MPDTPAALIVQASAHVRAGALDEAACCGLEALAQDPAHFDSLHLLGWMCMERRQPADASAYLARAASVRPDVAAMQILRGNALVALRRFKEAEDVARGILAAQPDHIDTRNNLGIALAEQDRHEDAIAVFQALLTDKSDHAPAWFNVAKPLKQLGRLQETEDALRAALHHAPSDTPAIWIENIVNRLGDVLIERDRPEEALTLLRDMGARRSDLPSLSWNISLLLLQLGDYEAGWKAYEARWGIKGHDAPRQDASVPDPAGVAGKRVLIVAEQGHGDIIQFVRYAPLLADRGATVTVATYDGLKPLLSSLRGIKRVIGEDENEPEYDVVTAVGSLPLAFGTTIGTVPAAVPYLHAEPHRVARWREKLGDRTMPRVGLTWYTTTVAPKRARLQELGPILACPGIVFHALQKAIPPDEQKMLPAVGLRDHRADLTDFAETAALIENLDLVITIDTAVAHLAGAMGKPVWLMLQHVADWRWLRYRGDSPWYPTARLFRQAAPGDWHGLSVEVATALMRLFPPSVSC
jgi:predicted Zn-dependent protease